MTTRVKSIMAAGVMLALGPIAAQAVPVTFNYTADNSVDFWGQCVVMDCSGGNVFPNGANEDEWRQADSYTTVDLGPGTYYFAFFTENFPNPNSGNPGGFLAEIIWGGNTVVTSTSWDVAVSGDFGGWVAATSYGKNGADNIWTSVRGSAVSGISTDASWIWTDRNFADRACAGADDTDCTDQNVMFRVGITIASVPEPTSLALLGLGLLGMGMRRRLKA